MSPKGLPMDFDNRFKMEHFKSSNKEPNIAPLGMHGNLQQKVNNASAKLYANYDYAARHQKKLSGGVSHS